ncbi:hypothetical protein D3C83_100930 [compost metagenome]
MFGPVAWPAGMPTAVCGTPVADCATCERGTSARPLPGTLKNAGAPAEKVSGSYLKRMHWKP